MKHARADHRNPTMSRRQSACTSPTLPCDDSPASAAAAAPAFSSRQLRGRIREILYDDLSRGREALALHLIVTPGISVPDAMAILRAAARTP